MLKCHMRHRFYLLCATVGSNERPNNHSTWMLLYFWHITVYCLLEQTHKTTYFGAILGKLLYRNKVEHFRELSVYLAILI